MSSAIEALKGMIEQYKAFTSQFPNSKLDKLDAEAKALGEAIVALEKQEAGQYGVDFNNAEIKLKELKEWLEKKGEYAIITVEQVKEVLGEL